MRKWLITNRCTDRGKARLLGAGFASVVHAMTIGMAINALTSKLLRDRIPMPDREQLIVRLRSIATIYEKSGPNYKALLKSVDLLEADARTAEKQNKIANTFLREREANLVRAEKAEREGERLREALGKLVEKYGDGPGGQGSVLTSRTGATAETKYQAGRADGCNAVALELKQLLAALNPSEDQPDLSPQDEADLRESKDL